MADIASVWKDWAGQWLVQDGTLASDDGLRTAILISLFTDRLADAGDVLPGGTADRRGWWGDAHAAQPGDLIGSRLWLLGREKQQLRVLRRAEDYAREALQWLIDDGVASAVTVVAELVNLPGVQGVMGLSVAVTRNAQTVVRYRFEAFWKGA